MSDNATASAWKLFLMAAAVLAGMAVITGALVQLGPWVGSLLTN
jgi:hypothetical protein